MDGVESKVRLAGEEAPISQERQRESYSMDGKITFNVKYGALDGDKRAKGVVVIVEVHQGQLDKIFLALGQRMILLSTL